MFDFLKKLLFRFVKNYGGVDLESVQNGDNSSLYDTGESFGDKLGTGLLNLINRFTDAHATGGEIERNQMQMQNAEDIYQRQVTGMQKAGLNPALMYQSGANVTPPSVSTSASSSPINMSDLMSLINLPLQHKVMKAQAQMFSDQGEGAIMQGKAALQNAGTNATNAGTNKQNADTARFDAETRRMQKDIEEKRLKVYEELSDAEKKVLSEQAANIKLQTEQLPEKLDISKREVSAQEKQAFAALQTAQANVQNAASNDRRTDYETSLMYAQEYVEWANKEGKEIVNRYLDDNEKQKLENLRKQGVYLDKQCHLVDKTGQFLTSQMVRNYVESACSISNAANKWCNPLSGMSSAMPTDWNVGSTLGAGTAVQMFGGF